MTKSTGKESNTDQVNQTTAKQAQKDILKAIFYCLLVVVTVRSFIVEPFRIPSGSMIPTLRIGDHIFVSKFSYGLSLPFTKFQFLKLAEPKRGDIIVFLWPRDESLYYVKRVVGLPGDKVQVKGRDLWINDQILEKQPVSADPNQLDLTHSELADEVGSGTVFFKEKLDSVNHLVRHLSQGALGHESREYLEVVPPNHFFVMGDNRDDSSDSRSWGFVPRENIKGKAQLIWLSLDQEGAWNTLKKIRWDRCLKLIR